MGHSNLREESRHVSPLDFFDSGRHLIYTVIADDYDSLKIPLWRPSNVDYLAFVTRCPDPVVRGWRISELTNNLGDSKLLNRRMKILGIEHEERYDSVIYIDGSIQIVGSLEHVIGRFLESGEAIGLFRHFDRSNPWDEIVACTRLGYLSTKEKMVEEARLQPFKDKDICLTLFDAGVILKNPRKEVLSEISGRWYELFMQNPIRDQLSLPIVVWEHEQEVLQFEHWKKIDLPTFLRHPHKASGRLLKLAFSIKSCRLWLLHRVPAITRKLRKWLSEEILTR